MRTGVDTCVLFRNRSGSKTAALFFAETRRALATQDQFVCQIVRASKTSEASTRSG